MSAQLQILDGQDADGADVLSDNDPDEDEQAIDQPGGSDEETKEDSKSKTKSKNKKSKKSKKINSQEDEKNSDQDIDSGDQSEGDIKGDNIKGQGGLVPLRKQRDSEGNS